MLAIAASTNLYAQSSREILIVGNELTKCAPVTEMGWSGNWGMAASSETNDFALRLIALIRNKMPQAVLRLDNIMYEDTMTGWDHLIPNKAAVIIIQIGDNWRGGVPAAEYGEAYRQMLEELRDGDKTKLLICLGPWHNKAIEPVIAAAAKAAGACYISLAPIAKISANRADAGGAKLNPETALYPGDTGMRAIAETIWLRIGPKIDKMAIDGQSK